VRKFGEFDAAGQWLAAPIRLRLEDILDFWIC